PGRLRQGGRPGHTRAAPRPAGGDPRRRALRLCLSGDRAGAGRRRRGRGRAGRRRGGDRQLAPFRRGRPPRRADGDRGLVALAFGSSPAASAPWGGRKALFGTNPIAFACPRRGADGAPGDALVIDFSLSKVARGKIMVASQRGEAIPEGWAIDAEGRATTDPKAALGGAMLPMGDAKGAALALVVEILATCFTGANFGFEASSFFSADGPPPRVGQLFLVIAPDAFGASGFVERVEALCAAITAQPGARLPGT